MKTHRSRTYVPMQKGTRSRQLGFNLVELMVSMLIGLILLAGISSVFISNKRNYNANDSMAKLQENARIAIQVLTRDLRQAGYYGCADDITATHSRLNKDAGDGFGIGERLEAATIPASGNHLWIPSGTTISYGFLDYPVNSIPVVPIPGTDAVTMRFLDGSSAIEIVGPMNSERAEMKLNPGSGVKPGEIMMLTDCSSADLFQVTDSQNKTGFDHIIHNAGNETPGNWTQKLSKAYSGDAQLMRFRSVSYFIGVGTDNEPSLFRRSLITASSKTEFRTVELIQGVENMQILFGETFSPERKPDIFKQASDVTNWDNVVAIRFGILVRALANLETTGRKTFAQGNEKDNATYDIDGDGTRETSISGSTNGVANKLYQRRVFTNTVLLRNLQ